MKNSFDLQISNEIDKTIKKLQWIPNTIVIYYIFKTDSSIEKHLIYYLH